MNETKLRGAMGFAMRAGKCIAGDFACERAVKRGGARLVLLDAAASGATQERYFGMCERAGLPCFTVVDLGRAIGKDGRMVAAVTDERFAQMIRDAYASAKNAN